MSRSWRLFLEDMREAARKIQRYSAGLDVGAFLADELVLDATIRNLEVLGEAAKGIPQEVREQHTEVDWKGIAGLRDILAHAYFALDDATLWDIVRNKVPRLLEQLDAIEDGPG